MPRIEIIPDPDDWKDNGDGTPTIDVCSSCANFFEEGQALPIYIQKRYPKGAAGSTDVDHPPYSSDHLDGFLICDCCGDELVDNDN